MIKIKSRAFSTQIQLAVTTILTVKTIIIMSPKQQQQKLNKPPS